MKQIICTVCPRGCEMEAELTDGAVAVRGNGCARGQEYAIGEYERPMRLFTSLVRVEGGGEPLVPVRSTRPIPRDQLERCVAALRGIVLRAPVERYTVVLENVFGTGVDIVTSGRVD